MSPAACVSTRSRAKCEKPRRPKGAPRGPSATYANACARCGCKPSPDLASDLENGALVVDLRLCTAEALTAICVLLREAPSGLSQIVLRDGLVALKNDSAYRARAAAHHRRAQTGALAIAPLRLLMSALTSYLTVQGTRVSVLDLNGAQLGQEIATLLTPLSRALRDCRAGQLRWLGLSGCRIGDSGLSLLLPCLAGKDNRLLCLEALTLASNSLTDVRLINVLLRARARLCFECRAKPLQLLDLSGNPRLGDSIPVVDSARASTASRRRDGKGILRPGVCKRPNGRRGTLVRALACAIAEGLPLRVLRLRRMGLDSDSLQPLLHLMQSERQRCIASDGALAAVSGFCLEDIDLGENDLEPSLLATMAEDLRVLRTIRDGWHERELEVELGVKPAAPDSPSPTPEEACAEISSSFSECSRRRARSAPAVLLASSARHSLVEEALVRNAISDGEAEYGESPEQSRESFMLQRSEDKRRFRNSLRNLPPRWKMWPMASGDMELDSWAETPLAIAGALGPMAAQSMVRQAILRELYTGIPLDVCGAATSDNIGTSVGNAIFTSAATRGDTRGCHQDDTISASASSSDEEADEDGQVLRANRLDQLRDAVLGALSGSYVQSAPETVAEQCMSGQSWTASCGELQDLKLTELYEDGARNSGVPKEFISTPLPLGSFFNLKLDEMHREALADRRRNDMATELCAEGLTGLWG